MCSKSTAFSLVPLFLLFFIHLAIFAQGYVLKEGSNEKEEFELEQPKQGTGNRENENGHLLEYNTAVRQPILGGEYAQTISEKDDGKKKQGENDDDDQSPLLIRMFEPREERRQIGGRRRMDAPAAIVDVDILKEAGEKEEEEEEGGKEQDELADDELDQLAMEEREIRRKPSPPRRQRRPAILMGQQGKRKAWAGNVKRKRVKLPPRHPSPAVARAAPTIQADNLVEEEGKKGRAKSASGRQFWVNALKTLLLEFRRMHPDIAIGGGGDGGSKKKIGAEVKENGVEEKKMEEGQWARGG